jgi:hypothetical protein
MPELMETQAIWQSGSLEQRLEVPALDILGLSPPSPFLFSPWASVSQSASRAFSYSLNAVL